MKKLIIAIFLLISVNPVFSQEKFADRLYFGGDLGLMFGSYTRIEISPLVGYRVNERISVGTRITYMYFSFEDFNTSVFGGGIFTRYLITESLFAHAEGELLNLDAFDYNLNKRRVNVPGFLIGGGYRQSIGGRSHVGVMLLYNLLQSKYTPYSNPRFNLGFSFGI